MAPSSYRISIRTEDEQRGKISQRWVRDVVRHVLGTEQAAHGSRVEVLIAGDDTITALNAEFMGQTVPTDVISFPSGTHDADEDDDWPDMAGEPGSDLGQIVVCAPQVARQGEAEGMTLREEAAHVLVHATLHLLGHDHELDDDEETMRAREDAILIDIIGRPAHGTEPMVLSHSSPSSPTTAPTRHSAEAVVG